MCGLLEVKQLLTSIYHSQTDGLVESFNQTLKEMLSKFPLGELRWWDQLILLLLLAIQWVPQSSMKFSPFELLYGHVPQGLLYLIHKTREHHHGHPRNSCSMFSNSRST